MPRFLAILCFCCSLSTQGLAQTALDSDQQLSADFWAWRAQTAPYTSDDINRIERPLGVKRDWSAAAIAQQRAALSSFDQRWAKLNNPKAPIAEQVDHRLIGSALARVHWEVDILKRWHRDPNFYIEQTLTPVAEALTVPGPYNDQQSGEILVRLNKIPAIIEQAQQNLVSPPAPFAQIAVEQLKGIDEKLRQLADTLPAQTTINSTEWRVSANRAAVALGGFRERLKKSIPDLPAQAAIGREHYLWFLRNVALIPYTPEELVAQAELEFQRCATFEAFELNRNRAVPPLVMAATTGEFVARNQKLEASTRDFLQSRNILTLPANLHHYTLRPIPPYLAAIADFAETDDFTSPSRLDQDGIRYVAPPSPDAGFFWVGDAEDPRISIVHEGTVGHYGQLCASWQHPDPIRRHFYDSTANEGIGFYAEEMMLQSGLYDDSPHSREIVYKQMRLRALRVIADVKVALGELTLQQAADYLQANTPMSAASAQTEVIEMEEAPGQKISYQAGKLQILAMLQAAREQQGDKFNLGKFHDALWLNGNVPIALQRWEALHLADDIRKLDDLN